MEEGVKEYGEVSICGGVRGGGVVLVGGSGNGGSQGGHFSHILADLF